MITIKCQMVYLPVESRFLIDITDRLKSDLKDITEKIEEDKFAFRTTDLSFNFNNSDKFWYRWNTTSSIYREGTQVIPTPPYYSLIPYNYSNGGGQVYFGGTILVYQDEIEIYRGDYTFKDIEFDDLNNSVDIKTYSWHSRLRNLELDVEDFGYSLDLLLNQIITNLREGRLGIPWFDIRVFDDIDFDVSGVLDYEFDPVLGGTELGRRDSEVFENNYVRDVWQEAYSKKIYGLLYPFDLRSAEVRILKDNGSYSIVDLPILDFFDSDFRATGRREPQFIRACHKNYVALFFIAFVEYVGPLPTIDRNEKIITVRINTKTKTVTYYSFYTESTNFETLGVLANGAIIDFGKHVICDGENFYTVEESTLHRNAVILTKFDGFGVPIDDWELLGVTDINKVFSPHKNLITWYNTDTWLFAHWRGVTQTGGAVFTPDERVFNIINSGITGAIDYNSEYMRIVNLICPTGSSNDELNGRFSYGFCKGCGLPPGVVTYDRWDYYSNPKEPPDSRGQLNWTYCTDPIHQIMSCLEYTDTVHPEDVIIDISKLFNAYYTIKNGVIKFYDRSTFGIEHAFSEDWIQNKDYNEVQSDSSKEDVSLSLKSTGFYDEPENPYNKRFILGVIRSYYKNDLGRWIDKYLIVPAIVGNGVNLGDKITVVETGFSGVVYEKQWIETGKGYYCKFTVKSRYLPTRDRYMI